MSRRNVRKKRSYIKIEGAVKALPERVEKLETTIKMLDEDQIENNRKLHSLDNQVSKLIDSMVKKHISDLLSLKAGLKKYNEDKRKYVECKVDTLIFENGGKIIPIAKYEKFNPETMTVYATKEVEDETAIGLVLIDSEYVVSLKTGEVLAKAKVVVGTGE